MEEQRRVRLSSDLFRPGTVLNDADVRHSLLLVTHTQDLAQLQSYDPWGKPGAGAPRVRKMMFYFTTSEISDHDIHLMTKK